MKRYLLFSICLLFLGGCKKEHKELPPTNVTAYQVVAQTIPADFEFVGVAKSSHPVEIRSRVEGYLNKIEYLEGGAVKKGAALFQIDPSQFLADVQEAQGELARQEAILWRAQRSLERIEPLYEKNAASRRDLDNATAQVLAGEAAVIEAEANLTKAELNLGYTSITSPIDGLTARAFYREGTLITPSINGLLTLVSVIDPIWVDFAVSDDQLLQAKAEGGKGRLILPPEQEFSVQLKLADGSIFANKGKVNFLSPTLNPKTGTMMIRATFENPQGELLPGQFVRAILEGATRPNAIFVPQESISKGRKGMFVYVIDANNVVSIRDVEVGSWYKNYWIVTQGLQDGEIVVAKGVNKVQAGSHVHILSIENK